MEIGIIGAGASGLMAAVNAAASGIRVRLLEHNDLPGRKILATGNGKFNFTNMNLSPQNYYSKKGSFVSKVLDIFSNIDSINFSKLIDKTFISYPNINFIIGGSLGIDKSILDKCNIVLSFSSLTFPHQLFRLMLLEQIYRSFKILNNERYHK